MKVLGLDLNVLRNQLQAMTMNISNWFKYLLVPPHHTISSHKTSKLCISIDGPGGLEQLRLVDIPYGIATVGYNVKDVRSPFVDGSLSESLVYTSTNVLVKTEYFSVNYADIAIRWGLYESALRFVGWPIVPGFDFSGSILWAGDESNFSVGDKVFGFTMFGAYSTHILVPSSQIRRVPEVPGIDMATAAAIPAVAGTALHALNLAGGWNNESTTASSGTSSQHMTLYKEVRGTRPSSLLAKNKAVLIHSAAGGVGSTLIQICKLGGYSPIVAVVGSSHKVNICKSLGATIVIDKSKLSGQSSLNDKIMEASDHLGYIAIFDANGVETIQQSYDQLTQCGRLVIYGFHSNLPKAVHSLSPMRWLRMAWDMFMMPKFDPMSLVLDSKAVLGFNLSFFADEQVLIEQYMDQIVRWMQSSQLSVAEVTVLPMADIAAAHQLIQSGQSIGKIVVKCPSS